jgi:hypothetical protein
MPLPALIQFRHPEVAAKRPNQVGMADLEIENPKLAKADFGLGDGPSASTVHPSRLAHRSQVYAGCAGYGASNLG